MARSRAAASVPKTLGEGRGPSVSTQADPVDSGVVARLCARPYTRRTFWKAYGIGMLLCLPAALLR